MDTNCTNFSNLPCYSNTSVKQVFLKCESNFHSWAISISLPRTEATKIGTHWHQLHYSLCLAIPKNLEAATDPMVLPFLIPRSLFFSELVLFQAGSSLFQHWCQSWLWQWLVLWPKRDHLASAVVDQCSELGDLFLLSRKDGKWSCLQYSMWNG